MATRTFTRLCGDQDDAVHIVRALLANGVPRTVIGLVVTSPASCPSSLG